MASFTWKMDSTKASLRWGALRAPSRLRMQYATGHSQACNGAWDAPYTCRAGLRYGWIVLRMGLFDEQGRRKDALNSRHHSVTQLFVAACKSRLAKPAVLNGNHRRTVFLAREHDQIRLFTAKDNAIRLFLQPGQGNQA